MYEYRIEQGPVAVEGREGDLVFTGGELRAIARQEFSDSVTLQNAGRLLRHVIAWHLDGKELKSRKKWIESLTGADVVGAATKEAVQAAKVVAMAVFGVPIRLVRL